MWRVIGSGSLASRLLATFCALLYFSLPALAGVTITGASPSSYSAAGQTITVNFSVGEASRIVTGIDTIDVGRPLGPIACIQPFPLSPGVYANCSAIFQTDSADEYSARIVLTGTYKLNTSGAPTSGGIPTVYVKNDNGPPVVISIAPNRGTIIGGTAVAITGANFTGATAVSIGGQPVADFVVQSDTRIIGTAPRSATEGKKSVVVTNPFGSASISFGYTYDPPTLVVSPASGALPSANGGVAYSQTFTTSGGTEPYSYAHQSGALPAGLAIASGGTLSGTPTAAGTFNFVVRSTDGMGYKKDASYSLVVVPPTITLSPASLPNVTGGTSYAQTLTASGGTGPYSFSVDSSTLPTGMSLTAGGVLSGTPTAAGSFPFTVKAADTYGFSGTQNCTVVVDVPAITIAPASLPNAMGGTAYARTLTASGGTAPYSFSVTGGALPTGMSLDPGGSLSGTPTAAGSFTFTVKAADTYGFSRTQNYMVVVDVPAIAIAPTSLPNATGGTAYAQTLTASGGTAPYSFSVSSGAVPTGMSLAASGGLSGTPTAAGSFTFTVRAVDNYGFVATQDYTVVVDVPVIAIAPTSLPNATGGTAYAQTFTASGGAAPYSFSRDSGSLPTGMSLAASGSLSGMPTAAGSFTFTIKAVDDYGFTATQDYTIEVDAPAIAIAPTSLPNATGGTAYAQTLTASGGTGPYSFSVGASRLPTGMSLAASGSLSGTPTAAGSFSFTVKAVDNHGFSATQDYTVVVDAPAIAIAPASLPNAMGGTAYAQTLTASGGTGPYSFSVDSSRLPTGMSLTASGSLSGTPTAAGSFSFTVTVADSYGFSATQGYTVVVNAPAITLAPASLPNAIQAVAYSQSLAASGGTAPYAFSINGGNLPAGMALTAGALSGTPTAPGSFTFTVKATDALNFTASQSYTLTVAPFVPVAQNQIVQLTAGTTATVDLTAGATGGPFTAATIVTPPPASQGHASITAGPDYQLAFTATGTASGVITVGYTLSNARGPSAPATVSFQVTARSDPSTDAEVVGLVNAQAESSRRFASAQIRNFRNRLEQLHGEGSRGSSSANIQIGMINNDGHNSAPEMPEATALPVLGYASGAGSAASAAPANAGEGQGMGSNLAIWSGGFVNFGSRDDTGSDLGQTLVGVSGGIDYRFSPNFVGGVGFGYGHDSVDAGSSGTQSRGQAFSATLYGSYSPQPSIFLDGLLGYSRLDFDSRRFVTDTGGFAEGQRDGQQLFGSLSLGYEHRDGGLLISPYASVEASWTRLDRLVESGAGLANLSFGEQDMSALAGVLGLRMEYSLPTDWGVLKPRGRIEYTHDFAGSSRASLGYADVAGSMPYGFDIDAFSRQFLGIGLGVDAELNNGWLLGMDYRTAVGFDGNSRDHALGIKLSTQFP